MADNRLQFSIGSVFNGEGFKKAQQAVGNMNSKVKQATGTAGQLAHALGGLDSSASKAVGAVSGLVQSFLTMGVAGAAIQAVMLGINFLFSKMNEENERTKKSLEKVTKALDEMGKQSPKYLEELNDELKSIEGNFDAITAKANAFGAALEGIRSANANGGVVDLEIEKLNKILEAHSDEEVKTIEATYALKAAIEKSANVEAEWSVKRANAADAVEEAESKLANIDEQLAIVEATRVEAEEKMAKYKAEGDQRWVEVQKELVGIIKKSGELEKKRITVEMDLETAKKLEEKTAVEAANASKSAQAAILQAEIAEKNLAEATAKRKRDEEAAAQAAKDKAWADHEAAKQQHEKEIADKAAADLQKQVNESASSLKKAQDAYAEALKKYNEHFATNVINEGIASYNDQSGGLKKSGTIPVKVMNAITGKVSDHAVNDAIKNGLVSTVKDADRLARQAARDAREQASKQFYQQQREQQRYERLQEQNRKTWSKADSDFVEKFRAIKEAQVAQKKAVEEAKQRVEEEKRRAEELAKDAASMAADTKNLAKLLSEVKDATKILKEAVAL